MARDVAVREVVAAELTDWVRVPPGNAFTLGDNCGPDLTNFSWTMWARFYGSNSPYLVRKRVSTKGYQLQWISSGASRGKLVATVYPDNTARACTGTVVTPPGAWHHIAMTVNRAGYLRIYIDGVADGAGLDISSYSSQSMTNTSSCFLGFISQNVAHDVYDARYFTKELSAPEVASIAAGGDVTVGLANRWLMDDGNNTSQVLVATIFDMVGALDGTMASGSDWGAFRRSRTSRLALDDERLIRIGLMADMHHGFNTDTGALQDKSDEMQAAVDEFDRQGCDAILTLGDNVNGKNTAPQTLLANMQLAIGDVATIMNNGAAAVKRMTIGNHDRDGELQWADFIGVAQTEGLIPAGAQGALGYWSEDVGDVHLVFLHGHDSSGASKPLGNVSQVGGITADQTTIPMTTLEGYEITDRDRHVFIENEGIRYSGASGGALTGCTRGVLGTTAATHADATAVDSDVSFYKMTDTQLAWLDADLAANAKPTIVCIHYRTEMDWPGQYKRGAYWWIYSPPTGSGGMMYNGDRIRAILEKHSEVKLVLSGHLHQDHIVKTNGITYLNLSATTDNKHFVLDLFSNGEFRAIGYGTGVPQYSRR